MARTLLTGNILRSGSIPTTALGGGVVTSSLQIVASLPTGALSSSAQVNYPDISNIPGGIASSSAQIKDYLPTGTVSSSTQLPSGIASSSTQIKDYLPVDTVSSSVQVTAFLPTGTVSSSTQLPSGIASSSAQVTAYLPTGTVSSSGQVDVFSTVGGGALATTGSNTFTAAQTISDTTNSTSYLDGALHIAGGMSVRKDVRISGSMTINGLLTAVSMSTQYVTSSEYNIGVSKITLNDDDNVRFAGLSIFDSGSSSPTTASIFWDSLQHRFIYENLSGSSYNSSIIMAGPKHTGTLGDEVGLTDFRVPVAHGSDHIDSRVASSSIRVDFPSKLTHVEAGLYVTGAISASGGINAGNGLFGTLQTAAQTNVTSVGTLTSLAVDGAITTNTSLAITGTDKLYLQRAVVPSFTGQGAPIIAWQMYTTGTTYTIGAQIQGVANQAWTSTSAPTDILFSTVPSGSTTLQARMRLDASGNLGLGVTPSVPLHVKSANNEIMRLQSSDTTTGALYFTFYDSADAEKGYIGYGSSGNDDFYIVQRENAAMAFYTNGEERIRIAAGGNVGIGNTGPAERLEVGGAVKIGNVKIENANGGRIGFNRNTSNGAIYDSGYAAFQINGASSGANYMEFQNYSSAGGFLGSFVLANGNVGIGITNPGVRLHIAGASAGQANIISTIGNLEFYKDTTPSRAYSIGMATVGGSITDDLVFTSYNGSWSEKVRFTNSGNVGIGTGSPAQKLHVEGNAAIGTTGTEDILILGRALSGGVSFQQAASLKLGRYQNAGGSFESYTRLDIALRDNSAASNYNTNTTVMTLTNAGNVGIGSTIPVTRFDINSSGPQGLSLSPDTGNSGVSSRLFFGASGGTVSMYGAGTALYFNTGATIGSTSGNPAAIITANGIGLGNNIPASGTGIKFPSTQSPSSDANMLDDYEEGTWTPTYSSATNCTSVTHGAAWYVKIGGLVSYGIEGTLNVTSANTKTNFVISLPFEQSTVTDPQGGSALLEGPNPYPLASGNIVDNSNSTSAAFVGWGASVVTFTGDSGFYLSGTFRTT